MAADVLHIPLSHGLYETLSHTNLSLFRGLTAQRREAAVRIPVPLSGGYGFEFRSLLHWMTPSVAFPSLAKPSHSSRRHASTISHTSRNHSVLRDQHNTKRDAARSVETSVNRLHGSISQNAAHSDYLDLGLYNVTYKRHKKNGKSQLQLFTYFTLSLHMVTVSTTQTVL